MRTFQGIECDLDSVLLRTDYTDEGTWQRTLDAVTAAHGEEEFRAEFLPVEDPDWAGATEAEIRQIAAAEGSRIPEIFVVDAHALIAPHEVLVIGMKDNQGSFRCPAEDLWEPQNNLVLSNLDFEDFAAAVDDTGVYQGF